MILAGSVEDLVPFFGGLGFGGMSGAVDGGREFRFFLGDEERLRDAREGEDDFETN